jgi:hypothetical protein
MQGAMESMREQLGAMQSLQNDAQQMDAAGQAAGQAARAQAQGMDGQGGQGSQDGEGNGGQGNGDGMQNGEGQATGDRSGKSERPFGIQKERAPVQNIEEGKILASTIVKAGTIKGEAREQLKEVAQAAEQEAAEEVDTERVSRAAQNAVKKYFESLPDTARPPTTPTTQPSR